MVAIRADVILAGISGAVARGARGASFMQLAKAPGWAKKPYVLKNAPYTIVSPHPGQLEIRADFGSIARLHKGEKGFKEGLPIIAYHVKKELTGTSEPDSMAREDYPSKMRRTVHTYDEIVSILGAKGLHTAKGIARGVRA